MQTIGNIAITVVKNILDRGQKGQTRDIKQVTG